MLSKRFQKQTIREIASLVNRRSKAEILAHEATANVGKIDDAINQLKEQLGFDPEMPCEHGDELTAAIEENPLAIPDILRRVR